MSKFESTIVLDHGSGVTRCGFAEDEVPRALIPTVVGYHRETSNSKSSSSLQQESPLVLPADPPPAKTEKRHLGSKDLGIPVNKLKIGNDALKLRYFLDMAHPLNENGVIVNFDALEDFWKRIYKNVLKGNLFLSNLIISLSFRNPAVMTEKCAEILFEKFNVPKLIVSNDDTLAAKYFGLQTGVLVDMGHFSTRCIPVFGKKCLRKGIEVMPFGGSQMVDCLASLLSQKGYKLHPASDSESLYSLIENHCYFSRDYTTELESIESSYNPRLFSNGNDLSSIDVIQNDIDVERIQVPELFFQPNILYGSHVSKKNTIAPLDQMIVDTMRRNDIISSATDNSKICIAICGGQSVLPNLVSKLRSQLVSKNPDLNVALWDIKYTCKHATWKGAVKLVNTIGSERFWAGKREYEEFGMKSIHMKWF